MVLVMVIKNYIQKARKYLFERDVKSIKARDFTIISSNCIGSRIYQLLGHHYNTPTIGLFFFAPCFIRFISNLNEYLKKDMIMVKESMYSPHRFNYPVALLDDVEIHFLHYPDPLEAKDKWHERLERINFSDLYFIFTDRDECDETLLEQFESLPYMNKICFTAKKYPIGSCIQIPAYSRQPYVGDLYSNYENFFPHFRFSNWITNSSMDL